MAYIPSRAEMLGARVRQAIPNVVTAGSATPLNPGTIALLAGAADTAGGMLNNGESFQEAATSALGTAAGAYAGTRLGSAIGGRLGARMDGMNGAFGGSVLGQLGGVAMGSHAGRIAGDEAIAILNQHLGY